MTAASPASRSPRPLLLLQRLSDAVSKGERALLGLLMALVFVTILVNVATRYARMPLYGIDEASIFAMVWLTFIGASCMTRLRMDFAVTILTERLGVRAARLMQALATLLVVGFSAVLAAMCWLWLDPIGIARAGFDPAAYAAETFNFVYSDRTQTLEWPTWIVMAVIPLFALTTILHGSVNLAEDLGLLPRHAEPVDAALVSGVE